MDKKITGRGPRNGLLALTGVALATILVAPIAGSASINDGGFGVKAVNSENEEIFGVAGGPGYGNSIPVNPEVPSGPVEGEDPDNPYRGSSGSTFSAVNHQVLFAKARTATVGATIYANYNAASTMKKLVDEAGIVGIDSTNATRNTKETTYKVTDTRYPNISNPTTYEKIGWGFGMYSGDERFNGDNFSAITIKIGETIPPVGTAKGLPYVTVSVEGIFWKPSAPNADQAKILSDFTNIWIPRKSIYVSYGGNDYYFDLSKAATSPTNG